MSYYKEWFFEVKNLVLLTTICQGPKKKGKGFIYFFIYIDTNNWGLKVPGPYQAELFGQISLPQSPRQETFWASAGFEKHRIFNFSPGYGNH